MVMVVMLVVLLSRQLVSVFKSMMVPAISPLELSVFSARVAMMFALSVAASMVKRSRLVLVMML